MCLLVFAWQTEPDYPLVVAANRDERLDRPADALRILRDRSPRVLGGQDRLAGGSWLTVNEHGVVAGLTNRPSPGGRDPSKQSRGELPLVAADQSSAHDAVARLAARVRPGRYNPAWLLIGDRSALYYLELDLERELVVRELLPGIHVLENAGLDEPSPKVDRIRALVDAAPAGPARWAALAGILADHAVPDVAALDVYQRNNVERRLATLAACVHTDDYGTRSAELVRVPADPTVLPELLVADGPPCTAPFVDSTRWWNEAIPAETPSEDALRSGT